MSYILYTYCMNTHLTPDACDLRDTPLTWHRLCADPPSSPFKGWEPAICVCTRLWDVLHHSRAAADSGICGWHGAESSVWVPCETLPPHCGLQYQVGQILALTGHSLSSYPSRVWPVSKMGDIYMWADLRKGVTSRKMPNFGTFQAIIISKQWGPLTLFLV